MDAFAAQLAAAHQETIMASNTIHVVDSYATVESPSSQSPATEYPRQHAAGTHHDIGGLLMQRAIQTQLYYLSDLRDEPTYVWLRGFLHQDHLDDRGRFNQLDGLMCAGGWRGYLTQLEQAPPVTFTVELAPPRLSAQQMRNPYLVKEQTTGRSYEETILPEKISGTLCTVARSLEKEWVPVLMELAAADQMRVDLYDLGCPQLQTCAARYQSEMSQQVVAGGEGDDQGTPLHALNRRIVARFCTRVALHRVLEELQITNDETEQQAIQWLTKFSREWVPRLVQGPDDEKRRQLGRAPPGHWQRLCKGADANDVTEALWQELPQLFTDVSDDAMRLYSPEALAVRLRRARAEVCQELIDELRAEVLSMS
jgi:hypothetical protein